MHSIMQDTGTCGRSENSTYHKGLGSTNVICAQFLLYDVCLYYQRTTDIMFLLCHLATCKCSLLYAMFFHVIEISHCVKGLFTSLIAAPCRLPYLDSITWALNQVKRRQCVGKSKDFYLSLYYTF